MDVVLHSNTWFSCEMGLPPQFLKLKIKINGQAIELDPSLMRSSNLPKPDKIYTGRRGRPPLNPSAFFAKKKREEMLRAATEGIDQGSIQGKQPQICEESKE